MPPVRSEHSTAPSMAMAVATIAAVRKGLGVRAVAAVMGVAVAKVPAAATSAGAHRAADACLAHRP